jgi:CheY-like chemotaxis protein
MDRILIVEDDEAVQKALKRLFEAEGYEVEISGDGRSALEAFRAFAPTAITLRDSLTGVRNRARTARRRNNSSSDLSLPGDDLPEKWKHYADLNASYIDGGKFTPNEYVNHAEK